MMAAVRLTGEASGVAAAAGDLHVVVNVAEHNCFPAKRTI